MSCQKLLQQMIGVTLVTLLSVGCVPAATPVSEAPVATSTLVLLTATQTPKPLTSTSTLIPPTATLTPKPPTPTPVPPTAAPLALLEGQAQPWESWDITWEGMERLDSVTSGGVDKQKYTPEQDGYVFLVIQTTMVNSSDGQLRTTFPASTVVATDSDGQTYNLAGLETYDTFMMAPPYLASTEYATWFTDSWAGGETAVGYVPNSETWSIEATAGVHLNVGFVFVVPAEASGVTMSLGRVPPTPVPPTPTPIAGIEVEAQGAQLVVLGVSEVQELPWLAGEEGSRLVIVAIAIKQGLGLGEFLDEWPIALRDAEGNLYPKIEASIDIHNLPYFVFSVPDEVKALWLVLPDNVSVDLAPLIDNN